MDTLAQQRERKRRLAGIRRAVPKVSRADIMWLLREIKRLEWEIVELEEELQNAEYW
jgi:hypothetical protein